MFDVIISGTITDAATGAPIPGANVYQSGPDGQLQDANGTGTDANGHYSIVVPDVAHITVSHVSYEPQTVFPAIQQDFQLQPKVVQLDGVTVRPDEPAQQAKTLFQKYGPMVMAALAVVIIIAAVTQNT